ncbi:MAG: formylglycine-generating enzyme family protein [Chloroflexota bacterium]
MKKSLFVATLLLVLVLAAACGGAPAGDAGGAQTGGEAAAATPTPVVLATPTPKPAPPTPTPKPTATPAPLESAEEPKAEEATTEAAEATTETAAPLPEDMVLVPAGPFTMGQDGDKPKNGPAHEVDVAAFEIDRFEVTNDEFARFADETGYVSYAEQNSAKNWRDAFEAKGGNHPVVYVTWNDANAYCEWAGKRLPAEAEWEKAARGEDGRIYPWGSDFPADADVNQYGNFKETGLRSTFPVGAFEKGVSPYGVYDLAGNVSEWTSDYFLAYPGAAADADPFFGEDKRVHRGGGWFGEQGVELLTYNRNAGPADVTANDDIGFRCARDAQ